MTDPRPSIDHGPLSPSGRVSKRAREAAQKRAASELFPPGFWDKKETSPGKKKEQEIARLRKTAQELRDLADRGMSVKKHRREAARLDAEADSLEKSESMKPTARELIEHELKEASSSPTGAAVKLLKTSEDSYDVYVDGEVVGSVSMGWTRMGGSGWVPSLKRGEKVLGGMSSYSFKSRKGAVEELLGMLRSAKKKALPSFQGV